MLESFALQYNVLNFNETLTNDVVNFEQLASDDLGFVPSDKSDQP